MTRTTSLKEKMMVSTYLPDFFPILWTGRSLNVMTATQLERDRMLTMTKWVIGVKHFFFSKVSKWLREKSRNGKRMSWVRKLLVTEVVRRISKSINNLRSNKLLFKVSYMRLDQWEMLWRAWTRMSIFTSKRELKKKITLQEMKMAILKYLKLKTKHFLTVQSSSMMTWYPFFLYSLFETIMGSMVCVSTIHSLAHSHLTTKFSLRMAQTSTF